MRLLYVIDARSPIALNWIDYFVRAGHEVHVASTFPADAPAHLASFRVIPAAFSSAARNPGSATGAGIRRLTSPRFRTLVRQWLGVLTLGRAGRQLAGVVGETAPELVHAMRIPYEGMIAAMALGSREVLAMRNTPPLLVSVWGNDFTLHAGANTTMKRRTRQTLQAASALHCDCRRDLRLAHEWGFSKEKPSTVMPGAGGVRSDIFFPDQEKPPEPPGGLTVIQPRGTRAYVQNDAFFQAIPRITRKHPQTRFLCPNMAGEAHAKSWVDRLGLAQAVSLLPRLTINQMAETYRKSDIVLSPTTHDGTPNTLLESLACGCFPVAGELESIREWISHGENGLLVDPRSPDSIAAGLIEAIEGDRLRLSARRSNLRMIAEKADYAVVMPAAERFYRSLQA